MPLDPMSFLVIEDDPFQRNMLRQQLANMGEASVHCAENGLEALRLLRDPAVHIDIVITDISMPDMDGIELLSHLGACRADVPLIFLSGTLSILEAAVEIAKSQGLHVLGAATKPIAAAHLAALIHGHSPPAAPVESD